MNRPIPLTETDRATIEQFTKDIATLPTWSLLVTLPLLETAASAGPAPRCLFAILADHLCRRLQLNRTLVLAHPEGVAAGISSLHRHQSAARATTN